MEAIRFYASNAFSIRCEPGWDGEMSVSTNGRTFSVWTGEAVHAGRTPNGMFQLLFRGTGNRVITGRKGPWELTGKEVSVAGDLGFLFSADKPVESWKIKMRTSACRRWMSGNQALTGGRLTTTLLVSPRCYEEMFSECVNLKECPFKVLPSKCLHDRCYAGMFRGCSSMNSVPDLPACFLAVGCYREMFSGCSSIVTPPSIPPARTLEEACVSGMFTGCAALKEVPYPHITVKKSSPV